MDEHKAHEAAVKILQQLGGYSFITMIGAYDLMYRIDAKRQPYLVFKIKARAHKNINYAKITLGVMDWYTLQLGHFVKKGSHIGLQVMSEQDQIYADTLAERFREETGLETRMPKITCGE